MTISADDFAIWQVHPVTQAVFRRLTDLREGMKDRWLAKSWEGGDADPVTLAECRGAAAMANDILELKADDLNEDKE